MVDTGTTVAARPQPAAAGPAPRQVPTGSFLGPVAQVCGWGTCAAIALAMGLLAGPTPHRLWGLMACTGYCIAAALAARRRTTAAARKEHLPVLTAAAGAAGVPLALLVASGVGQLEVEVVERAARHLLATGSPYEPAPATVSDYNPYLPGMALFGLPHAIFGEGVTTDARWWMAGCFLAAMYAAARTNSSGARAGTGLLWLAAFPAAAMPLAVSGVDLPVLGLICLGLACTGRSRSGDGKWAIRAGFALGAAAALKWTAWPALPVAVTLLAVRAGLPSALRCAGVAAATVSAAVLPVLAVAPPAFLDHVVAFPLGLADAESPAGSPLPGHLLATLVPGGTALATALLVLAAVLLAASLLLRPPATARAAADRLALGLLAAFCLAPATRFGYLLLPLVLCCWFRLPRLPQETHHVPDARRHQ